MKKDIRIEFLKEKNIKTLETRIKNEGKYKIFSEFASFFDKRTYFKVNDNGDISLKSCNPILVLFAFSNDTEALANYLLKYSYLTEKQNLKKIDRVSNLLIPDLRIKLMKTLTASNLNFSKIFAKELFLKSKKDFFEVIYNFSLMGNPNNIKLLFAYSLEKIFEEYEYDDNILWVAISYLTKVREDYHIYINSSVNETEINIKNLSIDKKIYINIFNKVIQKYKFKNTNKFKNTLNKYFENDFFLNQDIKDIFME